MYLSLKKLLAIAAIILYLVLTWFLGVWAGLAGNKLWLLRLIMLALGLVAAGIIVWWARPKSGASPATDAAAPAAAGSATGPDDIDYLVRAAESKLRSSRAAGGTIGKLPAIVLLGETGTGKTSIALHSGLEPEHLAGQIFEAGAVAPTQSINLWFARQAILAEAAGSLASDPARWLHFIRRLAPSKLGSVLGGRRQAARAAVVCFDCDTFVKSASVDSIMASAKMLQARLREMAQALGINLPVYVLFTRADAVPFFAEYVAPLNPQEAAQTLGVTLPMVDYRTGLYAEEETKRLTAAFEQLFRSLSDHRAEYLSREPDESRLPGIYEFPREFRKLRSMLVQMLVELCRPSQLTAGPFLRGFYFTGVRMVLAETPPALAPELRPPAAESNVGATQIFDARQWQAASGGPAQDFPAGATVAFDARSILSPGFAAAAPSARARWIPQWLFVGRFFSDLVFQDHAALGASGSSARVGFWRRFLLASATAALAVLSVAFVVSFINNRRLESRLEEEVRAAALLGPLAGNQLPAVSDLQTLDRLGRDLATLSRWHREWPPLRYRWWLYAGDDLEPLVCRAYARGFDRLLLGPTQAAMVAFLNSLRYNAPTDPYDEPYRTLKAYLLTTSQGAHAKEDPAFLAPVLTQAWSGGRTLDPGLEGLAARQFESYGAELAGGATDCLASPADPAAALNAQIYLSKFPPDQRVYQAMLSDAAKKAGRGIDFNQDYPGSDKVVVDRKLVSGAFTKEGWNWMTDAMAHPERYSGGESWVLGNQSVASTITPALVSSIRDRYQQQFIAEWKAFLKAARFVPYGGAEEAVNKLNVIAGARSPLLSLFCVVAQNTSVGEKSIAGVFSPVNSVVDPKDCEAQTPAGPASPNKDYTASLFDLQSCLRLVLAAAPADRDQQKQQCAQKTPAAQSTVSKLVAQGQGTDPETNNLAQNLLMAPIVELAGNFKAAPPPGAKDLCEALRTLGFKLPFDANGRTEATLQEFQAVFQPGTGLLAQHAPPAGGNAKPFAPYLSFYASAAEIQKALYPDGKNLVLRYTLLALPSAGVTDFRLTIGGQTLTPTSGPRQFVWSGNPQETVQLAVPGLATISKSGPWDVFDFIATYSDSGQLGAQGYIFTIPVTVGRVTASSPRLRLLLNAGAATGLFKSGYLRNLRCVARVSQ